MICEIILLIVDLRLSYSIHCLLFSKVMGFLLPINLALSIRNECIEVSLTIASDFTYGAVGFSPGMRPRPRLRSIARIVLHPRSSGATTQRRRCTGCIMCQPWERRKRRRRYATHATGTVPLVILLDDSRVSVINLSTLQAL